MADGKLHRQPLPLLAAVGLLLPAIIALAVWFYSNQEQRRADVERTALQTARQMIELTDVELEANMRTLALLADSPALASSSDLPRWRDFIERTTRQTPGWRGIVLRRSDSAAPILEASTQPDGRPLQPLPRVVAADGAIEGVLREGRYCPCVILHRRAAEDRGLVITLYLDPQLFQQIVQAKTPSGRIGAIVDRRGTFAARSLAYRARVGTPGTTYLRRAAARGGEDIYRGVTYEGVANYSAFAASPRTGWSAHEAVDRSTIDSARTWSNAATAIGILAALALAAGLALYGIYEMRSRRRDEDRFLEMQKSETISRFTGTVVHDFRNILAVVEAGLNLIARQRTKVQMEKTIHEVRDTLARGERLANQLLSFVRGDGAEIRTIDLRVLMEGSEALLRRSLGDDIDFTWKVADDARYARANLDQLELALLNLAINARDALAGPGRFTIATRKDCDRVVIAVGDNGPGIPPHRRQEVFEIYVTTKPAGKGTGLGLAQVAGAMRQAEGRVEIVDYPGGGACFLLNLKAGVGPDDADQPAVTKRKPKKAK
jgi:signal transduction histidine kinase